MKEIIVSEQAQTAAEAPNNGLAASRQIGDPPKEYLQD